MNTLAEFPYWFYNPDLKEICFGQEVWLYQNGKTSVKHLESKTDITEIIYIMQSETFWEEKVFIRHLSTEDVEAMGFTQLSEPVEEFAKTFKASKYFLDMWEYYRTPRRVRLRKDTNTVYDGICRNKLHLETILSDCGFKFEKQ